MNSAPITNYNQINISNSEQTRVIAEIQAMVFLAKNDPRDENLVLEKVVKQCQRKSMAEVAMYSFPRGGQNVTGPSIRLAEVLGRAYGNIEFGVKILSQNENSVSALAYCWDLETNVRKTDYFEVRLEKSFFESLLLKTIRRWISFRKRFESDSRRHCSARCVAKR